MYVIGIDCATKERNIGLVHGRIDSNRITILDAKIANASQPILDLIINWIALGYPCLLALDAPLGWPKKLGNVLFDHFAGNQIDENADNIFYRLTDHIIKEKIGKQPLSVGADKIGRTAHSALKLIYEVRNITKDPMPLAWSFDSLERLSVIEVYPAATLIACDIPASKYKQKPQRIMRETIFNKLKQYMEFSCGSSKFLENADLLDAAICVLSAADFLRGDVIEPGERDIELAKKEGWIWVRKPKKI